MQAYHSVSWGKEHPSNVPHRAHPDYPDGLPRMAELLDGADVCDYHGTDRSAPPPACNTGVENSEGVDYVALTCLWDPTGRVFDDLLRIHGDDWIELAHGGHGYRGCRECGHVRVYYEGRDGMGSYCQISGEGCRELEARGSIRDWQEFAILAKHTYGMKCTRLDVFRDDRAGLLDMAELERKLADGECSTHAQGFEPRQPQKIGGKGKKTGYTLPVGSRQSDSYMRIYDKALELAGKRNVTDDGPREREHWVRVELELKGKRADLAWERLASTGFSEGFIPGLLCGFIEFRAASAKGHNGTRVPRWGPWDAFLRGAAKVDLAVSYERASLSKAMYYLDRQWGPTLATMGKACGGDEERIQAELMRIVLRGVSRMRRKHYRMLAEAA